MSRVRQTAEAAAAELLAEVGVVSPPVDVESIARRSGLQLVHEWFDADVSGTLIRDSDGTVVIGVNTYHSTTRQRFTVAHELGHWRLHLKEHGKDVFVDRPAEVLFRDRLASAGSDSKEIAANAFAAALLMPAHMIETEARRLFDRRRRTSEEDLVEALAPKFAVSEQAMRFRLINLGVVDPI